VRTLSPERSPAELSSPAYFMLHKITGTDDPYEKMKKRQNEVALSIYDEMKKDVRNSDDPLHTAAKLAVIGNAIDCGVGFGTDIIPEVEQGIKKDFAVDNFQQFKLLFSNAKSILYLCDNAGEIVFDKIFIEQMLNARPELNITAAVKPKPILNDATLDDAKTIAMDKITKVITTGSNYIGVTFHLISDELKKLFLDADIIISKGQGNFETLDTHSKKTFFLLKAKCELIANELGVPLNSIVFKQGVPK
jgi:uncharacterized protein with ATP-grasp and redox domains